MDTIERAIQHCGGQAALARAVGVTPAQVWQWVHKRRPISAERCAAIELATAGNVTRADLRPDIFGPLPHKAA